LNHQNLVNLGYSALEQIEVWAASLEQISLRITIFGCGHAGLVTGICLSSIGHHVVLFDQDAELVRSLEKGRLPIYELHLDKLFQRCRSERALSISPHWEQAASEAEIVFLCITVPQLDNGESDFAALDSAAAQIARAGNIPRLVVLRSTVPVQTGKQLKHVLTAYCPKPDIRFRIAANPQFLREGTAVEDFLHPDRILLGTEDAFSEETLREVYRPLLTPGLRCPLHPGGCPSRKFPELILTGVQSAELMKHASNAFLAVKISYANVLADLCERLGADIKEVTKAVGLDQRIGSKFLEAGIGFGGPRLPVHLRSFCHLAERVGVEAGILRAAEEVNRSRVALLFTKIQNSLWVLKDKRIGLLGLAHKSGTDDVRGSPAIELLIRLSVAGAEVRAFDPQAMAKARAAFPHFVCGLDAYEIAHQAEALILATDWPEFNNIDWKRVRDIMARPVVFDGRNLLSPSDMRTLGFEYHSVGQPDC
jgi:UDPglucose 6-dehydrogenase